MKRIFFIILLIVPAVLFAQTAGLPAIFFSFAFLLFGGFILGLFEAFIFKTSTTLLVRIEKIIAYNYLILVLSYLIFAFLVFINIEYFPITIDSGYTMEDSLVRERKATVKLLLSIILYFGIVIGTKYLIYRNLRMTETKGIYLIVLLLIPNIIFLGFYFYISFNNLLWWF